MTPNLYAAKTDSNQPDIVKALRDVGATVYILARVGQGLPDLAVGYHGKNYFMEVKTATGKLTKEEQEFFDTWRGQAAIVRTADEALALIDAVEYNVTDTGGYTMRVYFGDDDKVLGFDFKGEGTA